MQNLISLSSPRWSSQDLRDLASEAFQCDDDARAALVAAELRRRGEDDDAEDIERKLALREIAEALNPYGDWATGCDTHETAREWNECEFGADQVREWLEAGCYRATDAAALRDAGVTPEQAAMEVEVPFWDFRGALAGAVCDGSMSVEGALERLRQEPAS